MLLEVVLVFLELFPFFEDLPSLFERHETVLILIEGLVDAVPALLTGIAEGRLWIDLHVEADKLIEVYCAVAVVI